MNIGNEIQRIRKEQCLTQEEFGGIFHVTRQAVSLWENGKTYPDLQTLVEISSRFGISLDALLKEDSKMVQAIDQERAAGAIRREKALIDMFTGAGTGIVASSLFSPPSALRTMMILMGFIMISVGWYKSTTY
jgi:transcriptional regulator with XRE-family HTH domain